MNHPAPPMEKSHPSAMPEDRGPGGDLPIRLKSADDLTVCERNSAASPQDRKPEDYIVRSSISSTLEAPHERPQNNDPEIPTQLANQEATVENGSVQGEDARSAAPPSETPIDAALGQSELGVLAGKKKRKSKSKSKMKKGLDQPSGFEDYYVDPPLTAEEYAYEQGLYIIAEPFHRRIENAIQRYSERRKFNELRRNLWVKYLRYGGIDTGPKMFGGVSSKDLRDIDEDEEGGDIQTLKAREFVSEDVYKDILDEDEQRENAKYEVDFDAVVSGFFSTHLPGMLPMETQDQVKLYTGVIRNWLNYLLHHNVCNEYKDQILAARATCNRAETELWLLGPLSSKLPEQFNEACRALYLPPDLYDWEDAWTVPSEMNYELATRVFLTALAALGDDTLVDRYMEQNEDQGISIVQSLETGIEIISIEPPTSKVRAAYRDDSAHSLKPVGKVRARTWYLENEIMPDLTEEEETAWPKKRETDRRDYELWIDEDTLGSMFVGLKMTVGLKELSFGIWFLDKVMHLFPSFATWLPNELMIGYREHEWIPPNRQKMLERMGVDVGNDGEGGDGGNADENADW